MLLGAKKAVKDSIIYVYEAKRLVCNALYRQKCRTDACELHSLIYSVL